MFAEEPKEQIISVGPIRRKRKCGSLPSIWVELGGVPGRNRIPGHWGEGARVSCEERLFFRVRMSVGTEMVPLQEGQWEPRVVQGALFPATWPWALPFVFLKGPWRVVSIRLGGALGSWGMTGA